VSDASLRGSRENKLPTASQLSLQMAIQQYQVTPTKKNNISIDSTTTVRAMEHNRQHSIYFLILSRQFAPSNIMYTAKCPYLWEYNPIWHRYRGIWWEWIRHTSKNYGLVCAVEGYVAWNRFYYSTSQPDGTRFLLFSAPESGGESVGSGAF